MSRLQDNVSLTELGIASGTSSSVSPYMIHGHNLEVDANASADGAQKPPGARTMKSQLFGEASGDDGRAPRYKQGSYFLPDDIEEQNRLDSQHAMSLLLLDGRLGMAPVESPGHVLDIGTGTGIWAIQYAENNPASKVLGTDISEIQRSHATRNCSFVRHDAQETSWPFVQKFDYVHLRYMITCFDNPRAVLRTAFDHISPGGWIELYDPSAEIKDVDGTLDGTALKRWAALMMEGARSAGRDLGKAKYYKHWLTEIGFIDACEKIIPLPSNSWPREPKMKEIGRQNMPVNLGLTRATANFVGLAGLSESEVEELTTQVQGEMRDTRIHFYWPVYIVYARKPS